MGVRIAHHKMRRLREDQLRTQQEVAADAGIVLSTYQRAEDGIPVSRITLRKIARALLVEPEELLEVEGGGSKGADARTRERPRFANLRALQASGKKTKQSLIELARIYGLHKDANPATRKY